jgi:hypothetical protein
LLHPLPHAAAAVDITDAFMYAALLNLTGHSATSTQYMHHFTFLQLNPSLMVLSSSHREKNTLKKKHSLAAHIGSGHPPYRAVARPLEGQLLVVLHSSPAISSP